MKARILGRIIDTGSTEDFLVISGLKIQVVRKSIKNFHLAVLPPDGKVRVAVPHHVTDERVRLAIISKLGWIRRQQADFNAQPRQTEREMTNGESHYLWGRSYRLEVIEDNGKHRIETKAKTKLRLYVQPGTSTENRLAVLNSWYREQLKLKVDELVQHWAPVVKRRPNAFGIRKMKTKWGSCNIEAKRIWLNLELVKKPPECLEYILVHELVHLLERHHNERFRKYMDKFLPKWRESRALLNKLPLAYEDWQY
ncbi:M48 family metallopeptidase [Undibacterium sp. Di24W]|uniref:M48 family metallopeptidase n=1 Tax=Undibacterium sp. Di24W TaxID=3413033 RepID=UPI003BF1C8F5